MSDQFEIAVTSEPVAAGKTDIWQKLGFYEHVKLPPSLLLRSVLPVPESVEGNHTAIGDLCRCRYSDGGFLTKRITRIVDEKLIEFEIVEQSIRYQHTIKLLGGLIEINDTADGTPLVTMWTYFRHQLRPKRLMDCAIRRVIKHMHRFVLDDLRCQLRCGGSRTAIETGLPRAT